MKAGFITLGCKVNIYESNALKEALEEKGFTVTDASEDCDVFVINTCSVTNMADAKSRKMIRKCIKMNPNAIVCACGCYVQTNDEAKEIEGVDILVGNGNKKEIVDKIIEALNKPKKDKYVNIIDVLHMHTYEPLDVTSYDHTRAFVKIEDGCENFCTFCIIPFARGPVRCKPADKVIEELKHITEFCDEAMMSVNKGDTRAEMKNAIAYVDRESFIKLVELERFQKRAEIQVAYIARWIDEAFEHRVLFSKEAEVIKSRYTNLVQHKDGQYKFASWRAVGRRNGIRESEARHIHDKAIEKLLAAVKTGKIKNIY